MGEFIHTRLHIVGATLIVETDRNLSGQQAIAVDNVTQSALGHLRSMVGVESVTIASNFIHVTSEDPWTERRRRKVQAAVERMFSHYIPDGESAH